MTVLAAPQPTIEDQINDLAAQMAKELNAKIKIEVFYNEHRHFTVEHDWTLKAQEFMRKVSNV